ncbi:MAG TPA: imidazoleglycerol-phosphate dehydratase HisB [Dehalococcoidia bacterium]|nr:imidazoleglycerol-phosphate dehydratase HisB [Dehalococcoidia bacterium]
MSSPRAGKAIRKTAETSVEVEITLDGTGQFQVDTGLGFFDHMLGQIAKHGVFDLVLRVVGDLNVDAHHTVEDAGLALGEAFAQALGDKAGIRRAGYAHMPLDESLAFAAVDIGGRPYCVAKLDLLGKELGEMPPDLLSHFLEAFSSALKANLHVRTVAGVNDHHKAEAAFKALARALDMACAIDPRREGDIPSTKGTL